MDLLVAVLGGGLGLVQALQAAIVALVQPPVGGLRQPHPVHAVERDPQGADRPLQDRGEGVIELDPFRPQEITAALGLGDTGLGEVHVDPAREPVLPVPVALAVADHREIGHVSGPS